ncbi:MAG: abortive infection protein [Candidatus Margulisbacteria bacterium GWF2_35_9]|nr:MAG: abortive infection protein [Candidatus Margulisbacteria bacterium GWF2_35_9]
MNIKIINWKLYFILLVASVLSAVVVLPYALSIQSEILKTTQIPIGLIVLISIIQSTIMFSILVLFGLIMAKKIGLGLPIIERLINKESLPENTKSIIKRSVLLGILAGTLIILLDFLFGNIKTEMMSNVSIPVWQGFLASFYGGIGEEILLRLFFMSLIVFIISKLIKPTKTITDNNYIMWISIIITSVIFGLGHLPATAAIIAITPIVILRAVLLNGVGGMIFGWLYWKRGLEAAIIAHFSADIILHVITPFF